MHKKLTSILLLTSVLLFTLLSPALASSELRTHFIDVGQGDAILIELPNNEKILIDAGENNDESFIVNYLKNQGINKINYLIGTHPHADHIGGLDSVISNFKIGEIYLPNVTHTSKTYRDVLLAVKDKGKKITAARAGIEIVNNNNLQVKLLGPIKDSYSDLNNHSIVTKVNYGSTSFLFTGDIEEKAEFDILASSRFKPTADVLKVSHHGSSSSTSRGFLKAVNPKYAVIMVGDNNYGHPSPEIISRLAHEKIKIYRTDKQGTIIADSNGREITFNVKADTVESKKTQTSSSDVKISYLNCETEIVAVKNTSSQEVDISGWKLVSTKGNQTFCFPSGTVIGPGETIEVTAGPDAAGGENKFIWDDWYIWNNDGDSAELYNSNGKLVSSYE